MPLGRSTDSPLERVLLRYASMVRSVARRRGLNDGDIEEVLQEVRIRIWRAKGEGEVLGEVPTSYVYRTAMSAAVDLIRRRRGNREDSIEAQPLAFIASPSPGPDRDLAQAELQAQLESALAQLPAPRRAVVSLHLAGYERGEIASVLGWSLVKTRNLLFRGMEDLRARLSRRGIGPVTAGEPR